jgi:hypothetical protein
MTNKPLSSISVFSPGGFFYASFLWRFLKRLLFSVDATLMFISASKSHSVGKRDRL